LKLRGLDFALGGPLTAAFLAAVAVSPARADCDVPKTGVAEGARPIRFFSYPKVTGRKRTCDWRLLRRRDVR